jgi:hypothetical protein
VTAAPSDLTRATRRGANAAGAAVLAYAILWLLTTQVAAIRVASPLSDDPWDAIASYAAIFLPFVAGPTWIRSVRHRGPLLAVVPARRIRWGTSVAAAIVLVACLADAGAIVAGPPAGPGWPATLIGGLVVLGIVSSAAALALAGLAARIPGAVEPDSPSVEPDLVDDLLALAVDAARPLGLRDVAERITGPLDRFLEESPLSPRRHRLAFGVLLASTGGIAFPVWHTIREGAPPSIVVPIVFAVVFGSGLLAAYLGTVGPLRLIRPPRG